MTIQQIPAGQFDLPKAVAAQSELMKRLNKWLTELMKVEGYADWKNEQLTRTLMAGLIPTEEIPIMADFSFSANTEREAKLVDSYFGMQSALLQLREVSDYFRRFPFRGLSVTRESHLRTCCEPYFSRVYFFQTRWTTCLKRTIRWPEQPRMKIKPFEDAFQEHLTWELTMRHAIHHEREYRDINLAAVGIGDLLSLRDNPASWMTVSRSSYRKITRDWQGRVQVSADKLNIFAGIAASLIMVRCSFLKAA